jgi:hypothetical protein
LFPRQVINEHAEVHVVNLDNSNEGFRGRVSAMFPGLTRFDYSQDDFAAYCKSLLSADDQKNFEKRRAALTTSVSPT